MPEWFEKMPPGLNEWFDAQGTPMEPISIEEMKAYCAERDQEGSNA